jgi:hypothetical protein
VHQKQARDGPGTPEGQKRTPLAPRQENIIAQQLDHPQKLQATTPAEKSSSAESSDSSSKDSHAEKHAQYTPSSSTASLSACMHMCINRHSGRLARLRYLARLHKLAPALRASSSSKLLPLASPHQVQQVPPPNPPQQHQLLHAPPPQPPPPQLEQQLHQTIGAEWQLFAITENSKTSPIRWRLYIYLMYTPRYIYLYVVVLKTNTSSSENSTISTNGLHTPSPVHSACATDLSAAGACPRTRSLESATHTHTYTPMDLSADEPWESNQPAPPIHDSSPTPSPTLSSPSTAASPPATMNGGHDWLGGTVLWHAKTLPAPPVALTARSVGADSAAGTAGSGTDYGAGTAATHLQTSADMSGISRGTTPSPAGPAGTTSETSPQRREATLQRMLTYADVC